MSGSPWPTVGPCWPPPDFWPGLRLVVLSSLARGSRQAPDGWTVLSAGQRRAQSSLRSPLGMSSMEGLCLRHPGPAPFWLWEPILKGPSGQTHPPAFGAWLTLCILRRHRAVEPGRHGSPSLPSQSAPLPSGKQVAGLVGCLGREAGEPCCPPYISLWLLLVERALDLESDYLDSNPDAATNQLWVNDLKWITWPSPPLTSHW